jgi:hypothetical protein
MEAEEKEVIDKGTTAKDMRAEYSMSAEEAAAALDRALTITPAVFITCPYCGTKHTRGECQYLQPKDTSDGKW